MKQTAVEWLYKKLTEILCDVEVNAVQAIALFDTLKQAKEMEAEQIGYNKEEVDKLLDTLIQNNMCSVLGDELIEQFKNKQ